MTITLLSAVNRTLLKIGELEVSSVTQNALASQTAQAVRDAFVLLCQDNPHWPWIQQQIAADSWSNETATFSDEVLHIHRVFNTGSGIFLTYVLETRYWQEQAGITSYTGTNGGARYYTYIGGKAKVFPYPADSDSRADIIFHAAVLPTLPTADTDTFPVPTRDHLVLIYKACQLMAAEHLQNAGAAQIFEREYERLMLTAKVRIITDTTDKRRSAIY